MTPHTQKHSPYRLPVENTDGAPRPGVRVQTSREWSTPDVTIWLIPAVSVVMFTEYLLNVQCSSEYLSLTVLEGTLGITSCKTAE